MEALEVLQNKLTSLGIEGHVTGLRTGPVVSTAMFVPNDTTRVSQVMHAIDDLSLALQGRVRVYTAPGHSAVGIEFPNPQRTPVMWSTLAWDDQFRASDNPLVVPLGVDTYGVPVLTDLAAMPHMLIAGSTGSGKSIALHSIILSLLTKRAWDDLKFVMVDAKAVELTRYNVLPHLLAPVAVSFPEALSALENVWAIIEARYAKMMHEGMRSSCQLGLPDIVVVIDELADLMVQGKKKLEVIITRIAQKARAAGVHMIVATQRPSVNVITGIIKANLPARLCLRLPSAYDSRTVIDVAGAEQLLGAGDALFIGGNAALQRVQCPFVSEDDIAAMIDNVLVASGSSMKHVHPLKTALGWLRGLRALVKA